MFIDFLHDKIYNFCVSISKGENNDANMTFTTNMTHSALTQKQFKF